MGIAALFAPPKWPPANGPTCQPAGGKVIVFNMMQRDDERGPLSAAVGSPYFLTLATGEGMLYTSSEYESWMSQTGFARVQTERLLREHGAVVGTKA